MGLRLANLDVSDWDRTPSKRDPRLRRDVRASRGMLILDMAPVDIVALTEGFGCGSSPRYVEGRRREGGKSVM